MASTSKKPSSLTPQRKHRKLLKDGSGSEVWPESLENLFVQGLKEYWQSPWATFSRGRSRWRNQFLVDYLHHQGIDRSKKQVASHIQVLRNMWKGEPQYHLVAGGEELFTEHGELAPSSPAAVKMEDASDAPAHCLHLDFNDDAADAASSGSSAQFSPRFAPEGCSPTTHMAFPNMMMHSSPASTSTYLSTPESSGTGSLPSVQQAVSARSDQHRKRKSPSYPGPDFGAQAHVHAQRLRYPPHSPVPPSLSPNTSASRVTSMCLTAEGMTPLSIRFDAFVAPVPPPPGRTPPLMLRLRLGIPPPPASSPAPSDPPGQQGPPGFAGGLTLSGVWTQSAKCVTRVYVGAAPRQVLVAEEAAPLQVSAIELGNVIAPLPESPLARCRWFESGTPAGLTQQIIVDDEPAVYLVYELDRRRPAYACAELVGWKFVHPNSQWQALSAPHSQGHAEPAPWAYPGPGPSASSPTPASQQQHQVPSQAYTQYPPHPSRPAAAGLHATHANANGHGRHSSLSYALGSTQPFGMQMQM